LTRRTGLRLQDPQYRCNHDDRERYRDLVDLPELKGKLNGHAVRIPV
jgi:hypothetical protein